MSVLIPLLIAAAVAAAIAKAMADAKKGIDESNASAGNASGGASATGGLPGLQQSQAGPQSMAGMTNPNAFAPPTGPHGQWNLNPFTVSGGANAGMPGLGMSDVAVGPLGTNLPPLQQNLSSVSGPTNHLSLLDQGQLNQANPFGGTMGQPPPAPMPMPMQQTAPPPMTPAPMPQAAPPLQQQPPTLGTGIFQGNYPWG